MSRLNPKAPDFSVHAMTNKQSQQLYNGYSMGNQSSGSMMGKSGIGGFQRPNLGTQQQQQNRWPLLQLQQPFGQHQSELISGMAGMTLHSIARAAGGEILENGGDLSTVGSSPAMSPNLPPNLHPGDNPYMEDRKQPQPIGTERSRKGQNPVVDNNWMMPNDKMVIGRPWTGSSNMERYPLLRNQMDPDYMSHPMDSFQVS